MWIPYNFMQYGGWKLRWTMVVEIPVRVLVVSSKKTSQFSMTVIF